MNKWERGTWSQNCVELATEILEPEGPKYTDHKQGLMGQECPEGVNAIKTETVTYLGQEEAVWQSH